MVSVAVKSDGTRRTGRHLADEIQPDRRILLPAPFLNLPAHVLTVAGGRVSLDFSCSRPHAVAHRQHSAMKGRTPLRAS